jgi:hypothetical protein
MFMNNFSIIKLKILLSACTNSHVNDVVMVAISTVVHSQEIVVRLASNGRKTCWVSQRSLVELPSTRMIATVVFVEHETCASFKKENLFKPFKVKLTRAYQADALHHSGSNPQYRFDHSFLKLCCCAEFAQIWHQFVRSA